MFELTINGEVYTFKFGIGFVKEVSGKRQVTLGNGTKADVGLEYVIGQIYDGDVLALVDVLDVANKYTPAPRVTRKMLEDFIEDENTDIDKVLGMVLDFFAQSNATKKKTQTLMKEFRKMTEQTS